MNTWQMIKELTETKSVFGEVFYGHIDEDEGILICGLNPDNGSIGLWFYSFIDEKLEKNPILYNEINWNELPAGKAKKYLGNHLYTPSSADRRTHSHGRPAEIDDYQTTGSDEKERLISCIEDAVSLNRLKILDGDHNSIIVRESSADMDFESRVSQFAWGDRV